VTFLNCEVAEAVKTVLDAAGGKNLEVLGFDIAVNAPRVARSTSSTFTSRP